MYSIVVPLYVYMYFCLLICMHSYLLEYVRDSCFVRVVGGDIVNFVTIRVSVAESQ